VSAADGAPSICSTLPEPDTYLPYHATATPPAPVQHPLTFYTHHRVRPVQPPSRAKVPIVAATARTLLFVGADTQGSGRRDPGRKQSAVPASSAQTNHLDHFA
jgi:hypothetical protein